MTRRNSNNSRLLEELNDVLDEFKAVLKSYDFDFIECEVDEAECFDVFGDDIYRIYELIKEIQTITEEK